MWDTVGKVFICASVTLNLVAVLAMVVLAIRNTRTMQAVEKATGKLNEISERGLVEEKAEEGEEKGITDDELAETVANKVYDKISDKICVSVAATVDSTAVEEEPQEEKETKETTQAEIVKEETEEEKTLRENAEAIMFVKETSSYSEQLATLEETEKGFYEQLVAKINALNDVKDLVSNRYETFYYRGRNLLVRVVIRKGKLLLKFDLPNEQLSLYAEENRSKYIKDKLFEIKIADEIALEAALDVIDIAVKRIDAETERKAEERKMKRRLARQKTEDNE